MSSASPTRQPDGRRWDTCLPKFGTGAGEATPPASGPSLSLPVPPLVEPRRPNNWVLKSNTFRVKNTHRYRRPRLAESETNAAPYTGQKPVPLPVIRVVIGERIRVSFDILRLARHCLRLLHACAGGGRGRTRTRTCGVSSYASCSVSCSVSCSDLYTDGAHIDACGL